MLEDDKDNVPLDAAPLEKILIDLASSE